MPVGTDNASELTREEVQAILVQPLEAASIFLASGPRIFDTPGRPVRVPKLTAGVPVDWYQQNEQITSTDNPDWDEVTLLPDTMASAKVVVRFSNEIARASVIALDQALRDRLVRDVAAKIDNALISGDGGTPAGTEPLGLVNYAGVQEIPTAGDIDQDVLLDMWGLALAANVNVPSCRWFMRSNVFVAAHKLEDTTGRKLIQPDPTQAGVFRLQGLPVTVTNRLPETTGESDVILADFSTIAVARDMAPSVKILDQTWGDWDQIGIRVVARYDAAPLLPEAIVVARGVTLP